MLADGGVEEAGPPKAASASAERPPGARLEELLAGDVEGMKTQGAPLRETQADMDAQSWRASTPIDGTGREDREF